jgi:transcriptional regulator with XRE-family HTH domain
MYRVDTGPLDSRAETARRVRAARAYAGISVTELAQHLGLGLQTIKRIECGKRAARRFEVWAIADACGLPHEFFELDFEVMGSPESALRESLERFEERLAWIERKLGAPGFMPEPRGVVAELRG